MSTRLAWTITAFVLALLLLMARRYHCDDARARYATPHATIDTLKDDAQWAKDRP